MSSAVSSSSSVDILFAVEVVEVLVEGTLRFNVVGFFAKVTELLLLLTVGRVTLEERCFALVPLVADAVLRDDSLEEVVDVVVIVEELLNSLADCR